MSISLFAHGPAGFVQCSNSSELASLLAAGANVWIDAEGVGDEIAGVLTETLKLHPLAVEDILHDRPAPKIEDYGDYLYVVAHGIVQGGGAEDTLATDELDLVLAERFLFTHHPGPSQIIDTVKKELERNHRPIERGPAFVAHALLDHLVDRYLPIIDAFDEDVEDIERAVVENPTRAVLQRIFHRKRSLQRFRRIAIHQREVLTRLARGEFDEIPEKALPFFRDVQDHFLRVADLADGNRDLLSGALDAYLSVVSNRMNEVMKTLTIVATVMLPVTFIAGVYGMNFDGMPELHWRHGYLFVWGLMLAVTLGMVGWFRHKKWI